MLWLCKCECGQETTVRMTNLTANRIKSCGCKQNELRREAITTHGHNSNYKKSPEAVCYNAMHQRCTNPKTMNFSDYGGRGIKICDRWLESFENFLSDMGEKPSKNHSIDRIDPDGNYEPDNCRWVPRSVQDNNKRNSRKLAYNGRVQTVTEWAKEYNINASTLFHRLKNYPLAEALMLKNNK